MNSLLDALTVTLNPAIDRTVTISNFAAGEVNRAEQVRSYPGGKGVNVACALADAGFKVGVTGFLGRDNSGAFERLFAEKHIVNHFVRIAGQTRVGIKITDPALNQTTDINFPGLTPGAEEVAALRERLQIASAAWGVLAGSLPPGMDPAIYAELTALLKAQGAKVALDTSGAALECALAAGPHLIKPNLRELETMLGQELPMQELVIAAARRLLARGLETVIVSMGAEGALFVTEQEAIHAHPPRVDVRSTVGAGDAMVAGFVAAQLQRLPLDAAARLATAFSLDAITRLEPGLSSFAAVEAAAARVAITRAASTI